MGLPDEEEQLISKLRQIKQETKPPRPEWKQIGKERLIRQAGTVQRRRRVSQVSACVGTIGAAALIGIWLSSGHVAEQTTIGEPQASLPAAFDQEPVKSQQIPSVASAEQPVNSQEAPAGNDPAKKNVSTDQDEPVAKVDSTPQTTTSMERSMTPIEERALRFLQEKLGEESKQYQIDPGHSRETDGYIAFRKLVHGIPLQLHSAAVEVNPHTGKMSLLLYPIEESGLGITATSEQSSVIDKTKAAQELASGLRLVYAGKDRPVLQYMSDPQLVIDAKTGKPLDNSQGEKRIVPLKTEGKRLIITDTDKAEEVMKKEFGIPVTGKAFMTIDEKAISFIWQMSDKREVRLKTADDGSFVGYELDGSFEQGGIPLASHQQAQDAALVRVAKYLPSDVAEVLVEKALQERGQASFTFIPLYQGVPVVDYPYLVTVEMGSGIVTAIQGDFSRSSLVLPSHDKAISLDAAKQQFLKKAPLELVYLNSHSNPVLVYQVRLDARKPWAIDALTGHTTE
ncbi:hypothetical protein ACQKK5_03270 [Brevibacillus panacihumi]|uniref:hypothetical protein n=1 Tax=Brevibacillus panacihumi TaxID=497735 RepID=UPI003D08F960